MGEKTRCLILTPRWRRENNIKTDLRNKMDVDWINLAQDRDEWWALVNAAMNPRVHKLQWIS
jgi:hypothetical protein